MKFPMASWAGRCARIFFLLITAGISQAGPAMSSEVAGPQAYLDDLVRRAIEKDLSAQRYWHLLLHYRKNLLGGFTSEADGPGFFLSPEGRTNPQAELAATLTKFFSDELVGTSQQQAQCAFPARYRWLKDELNFDGSLLPERDCNRFRTWIDAFDPESVTLIFASAYMNNPSSMFGHTLLRIDQKGQTEGTRLLAYAINFAANVTTDDAIAFAVLGLAGGFEGYFSIFPYYIKVQEYSEMENRDIWEYRLTFTPDQIERMLMHTWELGNTHFDYYFLTENCSYHLLSLLEIADPSLHLTGGPRLWIIPTETVRWIAEQPGLVAEVIYRPSRSTQIRRKREFLTDEEQRWLGQIRSRPEAVHEAGFVALPPHRQALVLDVAYDYLRYLAAAKGETPEIQGVQRVVLERRSSLKIPTEEQHIDPITAPPETGHRSARAGVGFGWRAGEPFVELAIRPAYHDLLDDATGYAPDGQIEVLSARVRRYAHRDQIRLERLTLVSLVSLSPLDAHFKKPSWKVSAGLETVPGGGCGLCTAYNANLGAGGAVEGRLVGREVLYALAELDFNYGEVYEKDHRIGGGGTVGLLAEPIRGWRFNLTATYLNFPVGDRSDDLRASLQQNFALGKNLALRLELNRRDRQNESVVTLNVYF